MGRGVILKGSRTEVVVVLTRNRIGRFQLEEDGMAVKIHSCVTQVFQQEIQEPQFLTLT